MNTNPVDFIFGLHFHQPEGNFKEVLQKAYSNAYKPLIESFKNHDRLKLNLHISAPLLEYFRDEHPRFLSDIKDLVSEGRIEMLGGCFYEPVLISIPPWDIRGQLQKMENFLIRHLGARPRGIWLPERVWEPNIPTLLKDNGVEYLALDDTHFIQAGFIPEQLQGYYMTEDRGNKLGVFIINKTLRYSIPFKPPEKIIEQFSQFSKKSNRPLLCMLDDGEKFGLWPGTKEWVHEKGWLEEFFKALQDNSSWIKTRTLSDYYDSRPPLGRAYLPTCQYYEMLQWAMPVEGTLKTMEIKEKLKDKKLLMECDPFITGGIWKNYFHKYPESNYANKKMLRLSCKLQRHKEELSNSHLLEKARTCLYKAQCNCAYWHGVFGGIYLPHLRRSIHFNLNKLQKIIDKTTRHGKFLEVEVTDIDCDNRDEILIDTDSLFLCLSPSKGGMIEDISDKHTFINHLDTVSRRKEAYHREILKEKNHVKEQKNRPSGEDRVDEGIDSIHDIEDNDTHKYNKYLNFDRYMRKSLIDHILPRETSLENFIHQDYNAVFTPGISYKPELIRKAGKLNISMRAHLPGSIEIIKSVSVEEGKRKFSARVFLKNTSSETISFLYGLEFNFALLSQYSREKKYLIADNTLPLNEKGSAENISSFGVADGIDKYKVHIQMDKECSLWYYPVRVVANSEGGFELSYQSSCLMPVFRLALEQGEKFSLNLKYTVSQHLS